MTREEAIRVLEAEKKFLFHGSLSDKHYEPAFDMAIEALSADTVSREEWVTCKDELPKESGEYLVTVPLDESDFYVSVMMYHKGRFYEDDAEWGATYYDDVIAWMPLPPPYCESSEQTDIPTFKESAEAYKKMTGEDMWTPCNKWIGE